MMNLVKVGTTVLNLDNVTHFEVGDSITVAYFNVNGTDYDPHYQEPLGTVSPAFIEFSEEDSKALNFWLSRRYSDADGEYKYAQAEDKWQKRDNELVWAFKTYQENSGELAPADWIVAGMPERD